MDKSAALPGICRLNSLVSCSAIVTCPVMAPACTQYTVTVSRWSRKAQADLARRHQHQRNGGQPNQQTACGGDLKIIVVRFRVQLLEMGRLIDEARSPAMGKVRAIVLASHHTCARPPRPSVPNSAKRPPILSVPTQPTHPVATESETHSGQPATRTDEEPAAGEAAQPQEP